MPKSRLEQKISRFRRAAARSRHTGEPVDEVFGHREDRFQADLDRSRQTFAEGSHKLENAYERALELSDPGITRRDFLKKSAAAAAAAAGAAALATGPFGRRADAAQPSIVIVGAGFAGMSAAYHIKKYKGWDAAVYEANNRVGGRARTIRGLASGQYTEAGPSGISTNEPVIQNLCQELGLWPLVDTSAHYANGSEVYRFGGQDYTWAQLKNGVNALDNAGWKAFVAMGKHIPTYKNHNAAADNYDNMSVNDWLNHHTGYPTSTPVGAYTSWNFGVEYGGPASDASSIHQILESGNIWGGGGYDERYAVPGGNDTLASTIANGLAGGSIHYGEVLTAVKRNSNGTVTLTFDNGSLHDVVADKVIIAIPPTTLRDSDYSQAGFVKPLRLEIANEGMGNNAKCNFQFSGQPWENSGHSGDGVSDTLAQSVWAASYQAVNPSTLIFMNNHDFGGATPAHGTMSGAALTQILSDIDTLFPGSSTKFISGRGYLDFWVNDPWVKGSYSYNRVGQFTMFEGIQGKAQGNIHFAGEHTAKYIHSGTMNGAVESGIRVAQEVTS